MKNGAFEDRKDLDQTAQNKQSRYVFINHSDKFRGFCRIKLKTICKECLMNTDLYLGFIRPECLVKTLTLSQMTDFRLFQTERVSRRQF